MCRNTQSDCQRAFALSLLRRFGLSSQKLVLFDRSPRYILCAHIHCEAMRVSPRRPEHPRNAYIALREGSNDLLAACAVFLIRASACSL